ncbi:hypothetical protein NSA50_17925 [Clostridium sp. DSM 100503]|uniref:hypothetical protein n=1 Tax=Clostridium sp. DSM 100503 TaxID=2963282 RepID=UPI00214A23FA|nr:hypothetical protein [Clostridium sp. DSM 100503]MCR1952883.1 hypothetical protein [Clostridium sp. DSM 100503]
MKVKGLKATLVPNVPELLIGKLEFRSTTSLEEYDAKLFSYSLTKIVEQMIEDKIDLKNVPRTSAVFTDYGQLDLIFEEDTLGTNLNLIVYAVKKWEDLHADEQAKVFIFLEEMCHWIWNITDEVEVKYKVIEILKRIYPGIEVSINSKGL